MSDKFTRREFLKLGVVSLGAISGKLIPKPNTSLNVSLLGRVAYESISIFDSPRLDAKTIGFRFRDELLSIQYPLSPLRGPAYNPLWYKIPEGYVHSALVQPVENRLNQPLRNIRNGGQLFRLTVPMSQPYMYNSQSGWEKEDRYSLYYDSNHWVTDIVEGPDNEPWYQITEAWEGVQYYSPAQHLEHYRDEELKPISPEIPPENKKIEVSLARQRLTAFEGSDIVLRTPISSGIRNNPNIEGLPTETPTGSFNVMSKLSAKYMGASRLTDTLGDKFLPGVPWTAFFAEGGYAIHGAYWHNNFGAPMSRGCINVPPTEAQWLFRWMSPTIEINEWEARGFGTRVIVS